ncbi:MAG: hypothetical protein E7293_07875 [Lachnospiraceae bacterium]|nr:hypothetical protein [Lachnospiraceae bacterium]
MKKALILCIILVILSGTLVVSAAGLVDKEKESIVITQQTLRGDQQAAEGWQLETVSHCGYKLNWTTTFAADDTGAATTVFCFKPEGEFTRPVDRKDEVTLYTETGFGVGGNVNLSGVAHSDVFREIAQRTSAGETRTEQISLEDYYTYYPLTLTLDGKYILDIRAFDEVEESKALQDVIQIPVHSQEKLEMSVSKNKDGQIVSIECNSVDGWMETNTHGVFPEEGCYFVCTPTYWDGEATTHIAGAQNAIYYMPIRLTQSREMVGFDQIFKVYELQEDCIAVDMQMDQAGNLLLLTKENDLLVLNVYEPLEQEGELKKLHTTELIPMEEDYYDRMTMTQGSTLITLSSGAFCLLTSQGKGDYEVTLRGKLDPDGELCKHLLEYETFAYDGKRLAIASYEAGGLPDNSIYLAVYGEKGLEYVGFYHHSGDLSSSGSDWYLLMGYRNKENLKLWKE